MRFSTRTFLFSSAPNIALLIAAFFFIENLTVSALTNDTKQSLRQTQLTIAHSRVRSEAENVRLLKIVSENAPLKAAMQLMALERGPDAKRTLEDQLREICVPLDLGFLSASFPDGRFMAGMIRTAGGWRPLEPGRLSSPAGGFVWADGVVYTVTANQVMQGGEDLGKLSVGRTFDLGDFETPAILLHGDKVLLSTVPAIPAQEIERGLKACKGRQDCQLSLANANYLITKLDGSWNADSCALISLESLDRATGPVAARLRSIFVTAGIGALGFALLGSLLSARAIVQPLDIMISHLHESEKSGDLSEMNFGPEAIKEVRELTASFNRAVSAIRRSKEDLQHAYLQFTGSLASALDARDSYTAGHSQRVSEYSCAIAENLGLSARDVGDIRIGALLHDIGKIGVSDSVLQKPGKVDQR